MTTQSKSFAKALRRTAKSLAQEAAVYRLLGEDLQERAKALTQSAFILAHWANDVQNQNNKARKHKGEAS